MLPMPQTTRALLVLGLGALTLAVAVGVGAGARLFTRRAPSVQVQSRGPLDAPQEAAANAEAGESDRRFFGRRPRHVLSPHETTSATVAGADMSINYGRPFMRGRVIFGNLVPYGDVWCPGADECTRLTTNRPLQFEGLLLKAAAYTLWMRPTETRWTLIVNGDPDAFHTYRNPRNDVGTVALDAERLDAPVEELTFAIEADPSRPSGGRIAMSWEKTRVSAAFTVLP
jgi:hypothetical protein